MSDLRTELKSYRIDQLVRRRRQIGIRSGLLVALATALAVVSLYRDEKADALGLVIAIATFIVALSSLSQIKAINAELALRKR